MVKNNQFPSPLELGLSVTGAVVSLLVKKGTLTKDEIVDVVCTKYGITKEKYWEIMNEAVKI